MTKEWKSGPADEPWKVAICERDIEDAKKVIRFIHSVLVGGHKSLDAMSDDLRRMTGVQIIKGLNDYIDSRLKSIEDGK